MEKRALLNPRAAGISFSNDPFDQGAERIVYQLHEIDANGKFVGLPLVGKDSKYVGDFDQTRNFHFNFCKTQKIANNFAERFNQWLDKSPKVGGNVPRIKFLAVSYTHLTLPTILLV